MRKATASNKLLFVLTALLLGCSSSASKSIQKGEESNSSSSLSPRDQYVAEFSQFIDSIVKTIEPVQDANTAEEALKKLKNLENEATELGKTMAKLSDAVKNDSEASDQLKRYLQDEFKTKSGVQLEVIQTKLGKSKATSKYPALWEMSASLINTAMKD